MSTMTVRAAYASVIEDEEHLFIGFAEGEDADEPYVLFRQRIGGGPVWLEVSDETFGAEDATETVDIGVDGISIIVKPSKVASFGFLDRIDVQIGTDCDGADDALAALRLVLG
jgi:hypothetical protein